MGLRPAVSVNKSDVIKMAPALTEQIVNQTSPATAASPRTDNTTQYLCKQAKELISKGAFQLAFEKHISDGPLTGPLTAVSHMDQKINTDSITPNNINTTTTEAETIEIINTDTDIILEEEHLQQEEEEEDQLQNQQQEQEHILEPGEIVEHEVIEIVSNQIIRRAREEEEQTQNNHNNNNTMGLQKDYLKENAEMEQMLGELASTSDLDLLQVFKSLESAPAGESLCDLAGSLSLFNDVDVMNMCVDDVQTPNKDIDSIEIRQDIMKRQLQMERKCDFLLRRLRKFQSKYLGQHINEEIGGIFEDTFRMLKRKERDHQKQINLDEQSQQQQTIYFDKTKPISTTAMKSFLKKINHVSATQSATLSKYNNNNFNNQIIRNGSSSLTTTNIEQQTVNVTGGGGGAGTTLTTSTPSSSSSTTNTNTTKLVTLIPQFDEKTTQKLEYVSGMLQTELRLIETAIDSDATASSSGGDSADEGVTYNNTTQESLSIAKRAAWRWLRDRSAIASRWSWLLAQISDLEYRIRQHNELHFQIKKNKGAVTFEDVIIQPQQQPQQQQQQQQNPPSQQSVNGYRGLLPGNTKPIDLDINPNGIVIDSTNTSSSSSSSTATTTTTTTATPTTTSPTTNDNNNYGSCRTRAFQRNGFRKRKLLQTVNLHAISKKAARPSTVKCGCQWPLHPCALCTGRQDPTAPRDLPDMMPPAERVSLLDPCFHPVLSFSEDVSHSIHFEAIMRQPEWQNKAKRCTTKAAIKGALAAQKAAEREDRTSKKTTLFDGRRKYIKKFGLVTNKLKKKGNTRRGLHGNFTHQLKIKHRKVSLSGGINAQSSGSDSAIHHHLEHGNGNNNKLSRSSKNSSPTLTSTSGYVGGFNHKHDRSDLRKSRNSYDIDNIVIPYSVAASNRVEILPYKEIPTPKWRIIEDEEADNEIKNEAKEIQHTSQLNEDISEDAYIVKHDKALLDERKKFQTFLKFPWSTRSRANRRTDSRAESSGANTPDPTSPAPHTPSITVDTDVTTTAVVNPVIIVAQQPPQQTAIATPATISTTVPTTNSTDIPIDNNPPLPPLVPFISTNIQPVMIAGGNNGKRQAIERRRTVSLRLGKERDVLKDDARRSNTPDVKETVPPYDPLNFPLPDNLYDDMIQMMPLEHKTIVDDCIKLLSPRIDDDEIILEHNSIIEHNVTIPSSNIDDLDNIDNVIVGTDDEESLDSIVPEEDPDDPEWCETITGRS